MITTLPISFLASILEDILLYGLMLLLDGAYRMNRIRIGVFSLCIAFFAMIADFMPFPFHFVLIVSIAVAICHFLTKQKRILYSAIDIILCYSILIGVEFFITLLINILGFHIADHPFVILGLLLILVLITYLLNVHTNLPDKIQMIYILNRDITAVALLSLMFTFVILINIHYKYEDVFWAVKWQLLLLIALNYLLNVILLVVLHHKKRTQIQIEAYRTYGQHICEIDDQLRHRQHEYYNQLQIIIGLTETLTGAKCVEAIAAYTRSIAEEHQNAKQTFEMCNDAIVTAIIYEKKQEAIDLDISFQYDIQKDLSACPIKPYHMAELLNNLLNNAFESLSSLSKEERQVAIMIQDHKIEVLNRIMPNAELIISNWATDGFSTKGTGRGYGLSNIKRIVEQYNAHLDFSIQSDNTLEPIFAVELSF